MAGGGAGVGCEIWQMELKHWTFGPFQENTWLIRSADGRGIVIDPGMSNAAEEARFERDLEGVEVVGCWLTHAHLDHVAGAAYVARKFGCVPRVAEADAATYQQAPLAGRVYGFEIADLPEPTWCDWSVRQVLDCLGEAVEVRFAPGHAPGHVVFVHHEAGWVIAGDVLFRESVGRTDLPGGDAAVLRRSIEHELFDLPEEFAVHCGHGPSTTIGHEKARNPFVNAAGSGMMQRG